MNSLVTIRRIKTIPVSKKASVHDIAKELGIVNKLEKLADEALFFMQNFILTRAQNPTGNISSLLNIKLEKTEKGYAILLGNIEELNEEGKAPYWYTLNYGYTTLGKPYIKNPLGYIQATLAYLDTRMRTTIKATKGYKTSSLPER